jgi:hypothetical protein
MPGLPLIPRIFGGNYALNFFHFFKKLLYALNYSGKMGRTRHCDVSFCAQHFVEARPKRQKFFTDQRLYLKDYQLSLSTSVL